MFPSGDTPGPDRIADLSGNVWEWTASEYTNRLVLASMTSDAGDGLSPRAVRGGSWDDGPDLCRAAFRYGDSRPGNRHGVLGFRVLCCPIQEP